jgi:hypothetical protein
MGNLGLVRQQQSISVHSNPDAWIRDGRKMARRDPHGVVDAIKGKHAAEKASFEAVSQQLKADGQTVLARRDELNQVLQAAGFDAGQHLREIAQAKIDLVWAIGLLVVNAALALVILLGLGPTWVTCLLAFLVLATALPVEEFFNAHDEKDSLREGVFLTLSVIGLAATFWLGGLRGLFLGAVANSDIGPANQALKEAGRILQFSLAALAVVSEFLCGYKFYRWRKHWHSAMAHVFRERDICSHQLVHLHGAIKATEVEPDVRREYRTIGANQELARQADSGSHHLRRAVLGTVIALIVLAVLFLWAPSASAASVAPRPVVVLLDLTISTRKESFAANKRTVSDVINLLAGGQRILVLGIADSFGHSEILMDRQVPQARGYLGVELRAARERLIAEWDRLSKNVELKYKQTDIIGTLSLLPYLGHLEQVSIQLVVLSDLRQSVDLDLERPTRLAAQTMLERAQRHPGIPRLAGAEVHLLGVDPVGKSAEYFRELREFWTRFFSAAGARVETFTVDRRLPDLLPKR